MKYFINIILLCLLLSTNSIAEEIRIIANPSASVREITMHELQEIFTLKKPYWGNGQRMRLFIFPSDSLVAKRFITEVLQMSPTMYNDIIGLGYSVGRTNLPMSVPSQEDMIIKVMITSGGIGYVDISQKELSQYKGIIIMKVTE